jgi:integrase
MSAEEITNLLENCAPQRRLLLETAFLSGLRANELRHLTVNHLDVDRGGLRLDAEWTKNRKPGFQPLPLLLIKQLQVSVQLQEAEKLYHRFYKR